MTLIMAFALFSAACCILFVYPYVIYPVLLRRFVRVRPVNPAPMELRVSLLFCAYNEAQALPDKIANLRQIKATWPELEVLAYDDGSNDGTSKLLAEVGDLVTVVQGAGRTGKAAGMKRLAALASGEILVFTDANVILAPDAIEKLLPYYADPEIGGVCGTLCYCGDEVSSTAAIGSLYWRFDEHLRSLESATGAVMGADGSIFSIRKSLYPTFPDTVLDDFTVSMSVIFASKRLIKAPDVIAYEKSVARRDEEIRRKIRIGARAYHTHLHLRPQLRRMSALNRFKYMSRKYLRWFGGLFLALGALFAMIAIGMVSIKALVVCSAAGAILLSISLRSRSGVFAKIGEILTATLATLIGVIQGMLGHTVATWSPAKSR